MGCFQEYEETVLHQADDDYWGHLQAFGISLTVCLTDDLLLYPKDPRPSLNLNEKPRRGSLQSSKLH
jgi:hypothetical protein